MLPSTTDNGQRLAAVLPTGLRHVAEKRGGFVLIAVDGLGAHNLAARSGHAPFLSSAAGTTINTVVPSTTGAALTTLLTGVLPGTHGLIGYRIRHPQLGIRTTLSDWEGIPQDCSWQRAKPLLSAAAATGTDVMWTARNKLGQSGLTKASIGTEARFVAGRTMEDRFQNALRQLQQNRHSLCYVYVDELDAAGHKHGWNSAEWVACLERVDAAVAAFVSQLPSDVEVALTADHGMVDVQPAEIFDLEAPGFLSANWLLGGEPRFVYLYNQDPAGGDAAAAALCERLQREFGESAWVGTRTAAVAAGLFGDVAPPVTQRIGDVIIAARGANAFVKATSMPYVLQMVGQHGSLTPWEREIPLLTFGDV